MKVAILYFSETGTTEKMAGYVRSGLLRAGITEVKTMNLIDDANIDVGFVNESSAVVFGTPCYVANTCWQLKKFFDTRWDCHLAGKLAGCYSTANCMWGGSDVAIMTVLQHALVHGMLAYSSGTGCGRPFIHLGPIALRDEAEGKKDLFELYGERIGQKALELFGRDRDVAASRTSRKEGSV